MCGHMWKDLNCVKKRCDGEAIFQKQTKGAFYYSTLQKNSLLERCSKEIWKKRLN